MTTGTRDTRKKIVIEPEIPFFSLEAKTLWEYRELLHFLVWRDLKVRYKQTSIGAAWALLQPLTTMLIFTVIFGAFGKIPSDGLPYPVFVFAGLLPWNYFSEAVTRSSGSLVGDANLIRKVYFPRLLIPVAAAVTPIVDSVLSFLLLLALMVWYGISPTANALYLPLFFALSFATALAVGVWLSALNVKYRDVRHTIPFLVQAWMYASPVVYPVSMIPEKWRLWFALNPMTGVIQGFRWGLLGDKSPDLHMMIVSTIVVLVLLGSGILRFKRMEGAFADVI